MRNKSLAFIAGAFLTFSFVPKALSTPVTLLELDWASQRVLTHALSQVMQDNGVETEIRKSSAAPQWMFLSTGKADVQVEVWEGSMGPKFSEMRERGLVLEGVTHNAKTREDWWYPSYVEELCPGLPDWKALQKCPGVFSGGDSVGHYYSGPWEKPDRARIRALDLEFDVTMLKSGGEINERIHKYIADKKPLMIFNWSPNWVEAVYDGSFVEFPEYTEECETRPSWGYNKKFTWDCGNPAGGWLKSAISTDLESKSSCAYSIMKNFKLTNADIALAASLLDVEKLPIEKAAQTWLEKKQDLIDQTLSASSCNV
ncbi:glycine/betaine ABC transporter substrate-binding protein [Salinivibrio sp. ML198]|uniref:ABC transporter substrate-binding protein n=1 Tax=Salinivibrio sp. ML198 TaxID=1909458 RepID=UPI000989891F|nr:ABC transporter substrate-binding protein [Salinivibrio sp. ML198]OOE82340.1 glycine/betaine ABC transporter substrate-binding protein [Salinivibrio sp. ML198]